MSPNLVHRFVLAALFAFGCLACRAQGENPAYNKALADSLGGKENG